MTDTQRIILLLAGSYLLGSIPWGLLTGLLLKGIDIRKYGSGNIGATNVLRLMGWPAALLVFLLDAAKGFIPVWVAVGYVSVDPLIVVAAALMAILGHNFSVFLGFKGGKGVATGLGVLIGISPEIAVIAFFLWVLVVCVTRYISIASIITGAAVPILMYFSSKARTAYAIRPISEEYIYIALLGAGMILLKHRSNLVRLINGTEPKIGQVQHIDPETEQRPHEQPPA